jgi:hypothetical protein
VPGEYDGNLFFEKNISVAGASTGENLTLATLKPAVSSVAYAVLERERCRDVGGAEQGPELLSARGVRKFKRAGFKPDSAVPGD